jgi:hypothetical protein
MLNKNIIIQIFQMAIGITKFSLLVTFYLDWGFKLMRHWRASTSGAKINQRLQTAVIKYQSKNFPLTNSTEVINTSRNNHNSLSLKANNQFGSKIQYIIKKSIVQLKLWVTEKLFNDSKTVLLFILQFNSINISRFVKITEGTKIVFGYGSCFDYMIELSEDLLNDRIYSDYKQVLLLIQFERLVLAHQLAMEVVNCKFHWWTLRSYFVGLTLAQMWEKYFKENFATIRQHDCKKTCLERQMESTMVSQLAGMRRNMP